MRDYDSATEGEIVSLDGKHVRHLVWIEARNRTTGATETAGFWDGLDDRDFTIDGDSRSYTGAGGLLSMDPIRASVGLDVQMHTIVLEKTSPEVLNAVLGYDTRLAPVEVHRAIFDPLNGTLVAEPHRVLRGTVDSLNIPTPAEGGDAPLSVTVADAGRSLTRTLTLRKSDAAQRVVDANDDGRKYAAISGAVKVFWGKKGPRKTGGSDGTGPLWDLL